MLTNEERIRALKCNLKNWSWDIAPQYRLEKEDATALLELFEIVLSIGQESVATVATA